MGLEQANATQIIYNNISIIAIAKNPALHGWVKHIDKRYHFIRNLASDDIIVGDGSELSHLSVRHAKEKGLEKSAECDGIDATQNNVG